MYDWQIFSLILWDVFSLSFFFLAIPHGMQDLISPTLDPQPGIERPLPAWDTWSLTSGPPGESLFSLFLVVPFDT